MARKSKRNSNASAISDRSGFRFPMSEMVLDLRAKGFSYSQIVKETGISKSSVSRICNPLIKERDKKRNFERYHKSTETEKARCNSWRLKNHEETLEYSKTYYKLNRESILEKQKENRYYHNSIEGKRRALKRASQKLLTPEMENEIEEIYRKAFEITKETCIKHQVDHIVPLKGKTVCGLHVPWNLQILTETENKSKGNKHG